MKMKWIAAMMAGIFACSSCFALDNRMLEDRKNVERGQSEFFNSNRDHRFENRINFIGGVQQPGFYHLPDNLNLIEAIGLAGGATADANLSKVYVKRYTEKGFATYRYDLTDLVSHPEAPFPALADKDTVLIEQSHTAQNTVLFLSIASIALGIITSGYLLLQNKK